MLITTHNMREADVLCDRVGVLHSGTLEALDTPMALKAKYAEHLVVKVLLSEATERGVEFMEKTLPESSRLLELNRLTRVAKFSLVKGAKLSTLFSKLSRGAKANGVVQWSIVEPSLEASFLAMLNEIEKRR